MKNINKNGFQIEFANAAGMLASRLSLNPTVGQIYGLLYMSPAPVSLNDMVEKLGISKGSASTNVRILESWGAVKKVWVDNSRKDYYEANPDTLTIISDRVKDGLSKRLMEANTKLDKVEEEFQHTANNIEEIERDFYRKRIDKIKSIYSRVLELLEIIPKQE